jgi:hypothetical protein
MIDDGLFADEAQPGTNNQSSLINTFAVTETALEQPGKVLSEA